MAEGEELTARPNGERPQGPYLDSDVSSASFGTTILDNLELARDGDRNAQDRFFRSYALPSYCFVRALLRRHGLRREATTEPAKDLVATLMARLCDGALLRTYDTSRGPFRPYLRQVLSNLTMDWFRERRTEEAPVQVACRINEIVDGAEDMIEPEDAMTPDRVFEVRYRRELLRAVCRRVQTECAGDGLSRHFSMFAMHVLRPRGLTWAEIGAAHGLDATTARNRAGAVRDRFRKALLAELARETGSVAEAMTEARRMMDL